MLNRNPEKPSDEIEPASVPRTVVLSRCPEVKVPQPQTYLLFHSRRIWLLLQSFPNTPLMQTASTEITRRQTVFQDPSDIP